MKFKIILVLFLIAFNVIAQPGDIGGRVLRFDELTEKLKTDPNNYEWIWERIELSSFNYTYIDIYTKSGNIESKLGFFENAADLFDGLNKLIDNNVVVQNHSIAEFTLLRGRAYYFSGQIDKAFQDYLTALKYNDSFIIGDLNDEIYISIAAYYYNLKAKLTRENARQTLKYVMMINPNSCHSNQRTDCLEKEKKELLKFLNEEQQLTNYYKELLLADYTSFVSIKIVYFETTNDVFFRNEYYFRTLTRMNDLAKFYNEIKEYKKSAFVAEQVLKYLPPDVNGQVYEIFPEKELYAIKSNEYNKRFFNLHDEKDFKELTWDYQDMSDFMKGVKLEK